MRKEKFTRICFLISAVLLISSFSFVQIHPRLISHSVEPKIVDQQLSPTIMSPGPAIAMMMREYSLPSIFGGPKRYPFGITHNGSGIIWITDPINDKIYRLNPAGPTQNFTTGWEYHLPIGVTSRYPTHIIVDDANTSVYFACKNSGHICRLNWETDELTDWYVGEFGIHPWDLVRTLNDAIWFTNYTSPSFCMLNELGMLDIYTIQIVGAPCMLMEIATNEDSLFLTDMILDRLYELRFGTFMVLGYPLMPNGMSLDVAIDRLNNTWVTQPINDFIEEQYAGSSPKLNISVTIDPHIIAPVLHNITKTPLDIPVVTTPIQGSQYYSPPNVTGDPLATWSIPTATSQPWGIAIDGDDNAWFTEVADNKIGVVEPTTDLIWEYPIPTPSCSPSYLTIPSDDHVWFTEYGASKIGELFESTFVDIRVCPSKPPHYPPPNPGSIRWTGEPGAEIWVDAPSNGYAATHHDSLERPGTNRVYAKIKNLASAIATGIVVKFYYHNMSLAFGEWIPLPPTAPNPLYWTYFGEYTCASLAPGAEYQDFVEWVVPSHLPLHQCVGVQVTCAGDTNLYDNVAYRNFNIVNVPFGFTTDLTFDVYVSNPFGRPGWVRIGLQGVPIGWEAWFDQNNFLLDFNETRKLTFNIQVPDTAQPGTSAIIQATCTIDQEVAGHVWWQINVLRTSNITCQVQPVTITPGDIVQVSGTITPARTGVQVYVHFTQPDGVTYQLGAITDTTGAYSVSTGLNSKLGTYDVYAYWNGDGTVLGSTSSTCHYTVVYIPINIDHLIGFGVGLGLMGVIALIYIKRKG